MSKRLIEVARAEVGYLEKASAKSLDSKTANAGSGNYTKYWRDLDPSLQGSYWCDVFVDWCFVTAYGLKEAMRLECGGTKTYFTPTSAKFYKDAGRWSLTPALGAQVFFRNSKRINHTGIVVAFDDTTITTVEGNTSGGSGVIQNGGGVFQKTYKRNNPRIAGYGVPDFTEGSKKMTDKQFLNSVKNVDALAKKEGWTYGDSHSIPPCADKKCSCDRIIARALWDLGYTDQPKVPNSTSGITVNNMASYLTKKGWKKITKQSDLKPGDVVIMNKNGKPEHAFVLTAYDPKTGKCSKYDYGSNERIHTKQPFTNVPLNEWPAYTFGCGLRVSGDPKRLPTKGTPYVIESAINKGYCLDIAGASMNVGANANLYKKNKTEAQAFIIQDVKNGYVRIINKKSGLVLDVSGGKAQNGRNVQQYEWNGTKAQLWKMRLNADQSITFESAINENYVLDVSGGKAANKQNVHLYTWNATKAQRWYLVR